MHSQVYHSHALQAWEQRWFAQQNSSYGLMQQVAWTMTERILQEIARQIPHKPIRIAVCCGQGNNAGDGYLIAKYLHQQGFYVDLYAAPAGPSPDLARAIQEAHAIGLKIQPHFNFSQHYEVYIDALFGIGLNRDLDESWQKIIKKINQQHGLKISIDVPSGLNANTGRALPCAVCADVILTVLGLKMGLFTGQGQAFSGQIQVISLIPQDATLQPIAQLSPCHLVLPQRQAFGHKGSYGHVLVVGGHAEMGGAVMIAAEAAFATGAGKVTVVCDARHHTAILSRAPNIMLRDINALSSDEIHYLIQHVDAVCFGMGLGRDTWAEAHYHLWSKHLYASQKQVVLDADALWFLAEYPVQLSDHFYLTPHAGEAAKLLHASVASVENDRVHAIQDLQQKYAGQWVLKGSGSLILENQNQLWVCSAGNAGMATGGMGDVLSGMIAGLKAQCHDEIALHQIVTLHAQAGDQLAEQGERGLQAHHMAQAIYRMVNHSA